MGATLVIDTSAPVVGVGLFGEGGERCFSERIARGAEVVLGRALHEMIDGVELDLVVVTVGPGAFTSLRVGVAMALGVAQGRGCPVVEVSSLEARAARCDGGNRLALLDGRKKRAYAALFNESGELVGEELDIDPSEAIALAKGAPFEAVGEGAEVWRDLVEAAGGVVIENAAAPPLAELARIGARRVAVEPEAVRLNYIREPDAKKPKPGKR